MNRHTRIGAFSESGGFSLVESLVAMGVLALVGLGSITGLLHARRITESSLYLNTATTVAQGYLEQIKNMEFETLDDPTLPTIINQGATDSLMISPPVSNPEQGDANTDIVNTKLIDIQNTPEETADDLELAIVLYIQDITNASSGLGTSRLIILRYSYSNQNVGQAGEHRNTLYAVRSRVPTF